MNAPPDTVPGPDQDLKEPVAPFEQLRALLLDDALAQLRALAGENRALRDAHATLQERHQALLSEHRALQERNRDLARTDAELAAALQQIQNTLADKEALIASLSPVIADLLERKIANSGEEMAEIVAPLMGPAIKKQVSESKDEVVEALYPVIGQTVRRAVAEAMRKLVRQINERLDKAFKLQGTWLRLKARLTGMPEPLVLIPQVFPFAVEQVFLIDQRTGLLLLHESAEGQTEDSGKPQMISGMLTAIQDFIRDAFGPEAEGDLQEVKYSDRMIFVVASPPSFLAAVTQGAAPMQFPERLRALLRRVHNQYHQQLRDFQGDTAPLAGARELLRRFMKSLAQESAPTAPRTAPVAGGPRLTGAARVAWGIAGALALALMVTWWLQRPAAPPGPGPAGPGPAAMLEPGPGRFRLEMRTSGEVWVRVVRDETDSTDFRFQPGEVYAWRAHRIMRLRVGNAGQTELYLDGRNLGELGAIHEPVTLLINHDGIVARR